MSEPSFTLLHSIQPKHTSLTRSTAESIRKAIMDGLFPSGAQLPPEFELTKMLGVSRTTLREAIKLLEEMGLIVRRRGLGTFVSNLSITKELSSNFGTATMIKQAGKAPGNQMLEIAITLADSEVAGELGIPEKSPVISLERVRTADQQPVVWSLDYIPADIVDCNELKESLQHWNSLWD
jgi:GntR family transcriptional regulator